MKLFSNTKFLIASYLLLTVILVLNIIYLPVNVSDERKRAREKNQRVVISIDSGEIYGNYERLEEITNFSGNLSEESQSAKNTKIVQEGAYSKIPAPVINKAPNLNILEEIRNIGSIPRVTSSGEVPWQYYSTVTPEFENSDNTAIISIVINNLGLSKRTTEMAVALPSEFTLSISPYSRSAQQWFDLSREKKHEVWIDMPLQPLDYPKTDPGPYGMLIRDSKTDKLDKLFRILSGFYGFVGVVTPASDEFSNRKRAFSGILSEINSRGLLFLYGNNKNSSAKSSLRKTGNDNIIFSNLAIDEVVDLQSIEGKLGELETIARKQGYAVGMTSSLPIVISRLQEWQKTLAAKNIRIAPLSAVMYKKARKNDQNAAR